MRRERDDQPLRIERTADAVVITYQPGEAYFRQTRDYFILGLIVVTLASCAGFVGVSDQRPFDKEWGAGVATVVLIAVVIIVRAMLSMYRKAADPERWRFTVSAEGLLVESERMSDAKPYRRFHPREDIRHIELAPPVWDEEEGGWADDGRAVLIHPNHPTRSPARYMDVEPKFARDVAAALQEAMQVTSPSRQ